MKTYVGNAVDTASAHVVSIEVDGAVVGLLAHHPKHSPTGFSWGYGGSGPADLARCLLIDVLGDDAWCSGCAGTGYQVWDGEAQGFVPARPDMAATIESYGRCVECFGERTSFLPALYQHLKSEVVAKLPQAGEWRLGEDELRAWLEVADAPR